MIRQAVHAAARSPTYMTSNTGVTEAQQLYDRFRLPRKGDFLWKSVLSAALWDYDGNGPKLGLAPCQCRLILVPAIVQFKANGYPRRDRRAAAAPPCQAVSAPTERRLPSATPKRGCRAIHFSRRRSDERQTGARTLTVGAALLQFEVPSLAGEEAFTIARQRRSITQGFGGARRLPDGWRRPAHTGGHHWVLVASASSSSARSKTSNMRPPRTW